MEGKLIRFLLTLFNTNLVICEIISFFIGIRGMNFKENSIINDFPQVSSQCKGKFCKGISSNIYLNGIFSAITKENNEANQGNIYWILKFPFIQYDLELKLIK